MTFNELIQSDKPILIDFFAEWCGPCKAMAPILKQVSSQVGDTARIIKIDIDKNPALAEQLGIQGVPTFMVYRDGQLHWRTSGMQTAAQLVETLSKYTTAH